MTGRISFVEDIQVKSNVFITARERGKLVDRREGHNIFLDYGREWLSQLIVYQSFSPDVAENSARVRYIGFGIGGSRQTMPDVANSYTDYGPIDGFDQTDTDPTLLTLERPVRVSGGSGVPTAGDLWVGQVQAPTVHASATEATFRRLFTSAEISYAPYTSVPLSEVGLFLSDVVPDFYQNNIVAYDTFDSISKTTSIELEVVWTLRFG